MPSSAPVGALYYTVYGLNESRSVLITYYRGGDWSDRFASLSVAEYIEMVFEAM